MDIVVLGLLIYQDLTIYQLKQAFKSGISLIYSASYGSLLSAIKKLIGLQEITFTEVIERGRNKKIYHITDQGRAHFYGWMREDVGENRLENTALCKVFFLGLIESDGEKKIILENILAAVINMESKTRKLSDALSNLRLDNHEMKIYGYQFKTLEYGIRSHRVVREWVEQMLDEIQA